MAKSLEKFQAHPNNFASYTDISLSNSNNSNFPHSTSASKIQLEYYNLSRKTHKNRCKFTTFDDTVSYNIDINLGDGPKICSRNKQNAPVHENGTIKKQPDTGKKFANTLEKMLHLMNEIRACFAQGISAPDGDEDTSRRVIRVKEFTSRFSRNYLYPLLRQLNLMEKSSLTAPKLTACYQLIQNGLQSFKNHLPNTIGNQAIDKFEILLKNLLKLLEQHEKIVNLPNEHDIFDLINDMKTCTSDTLQITGRYFIEIPKIEPVKSEMKKKKVISKKAPMNKRFSMYTLSSVTSRNCNLKRAVEHLAKNKYNNVCSRYKTAFIKQHETVRETGKRNKSNTKQSCGEKSSPALINNIEDNVMTLIQMQGDSSQEQIPEIDKQQQQLANKLYELAKDKSSDLDILKSEKTVVELVKECWKREEGKKVLEQLVDALEKRNLEPKKPLVIKESGAKNARLVCITDYNSVNEDECDDKLNVARQTQTESEFIQLKNDNKKVKISRLPHKLRALSMLPANYGVNIIKYKLEFKEYCKRKPLYMKTEQMQPWVLLEKLSNKIFDECFEGVLNEVELNLNNVVQKIYQSELQF